MPSSAGPPCGFPIHVRVSPGLWAPRSLPRPWVTWGSLNTPWTHERAHCIRTNPSPEEQQMRKFSADKLSTKGESTNWTFLQESSFFLKSNTRRKAPGRTGALGPFVQSVLTQSHFAMQMSLPINTRAFPGLDSNWRDCYCCWMAGELINAEPTTS